MTTVERRPRQFNAVWSDDGKSVKGAAFEESLFVDGAFWKNELTPVPPEKFAEFGEMFSSGLQSQYDSVCVEKADLTKQVETLTKQVETLTAQLATAQQELADKIAEVGTVKHEVDDLKARTDRYKNLLPFDPRIIKPAAFKQRLKLVVDSNDFVRLYAAPLDHTLENIAQTLASWPDDTPMRLDHENLRTPLGYLQHIDILNEDEMKFLLQDCTRDEAFVKEAE